MPTEACVEEDLTEGLYSNTGKIFHKPLLYFKIKQLETIFLSL